MRALYTLFASALLLGACSGDDQSQTDAGNDADSSDVDLSDGGGSEASTTYPAFVIDAPQVVDYGGPKLTTPKVQPVFFPGFDFPTELTDFNAKIGASSYWAALAEYKIGAITSATPITLTVADAPPTAISDTQIQTWLKSRFDGTHPEFGTTADPNTIYALYYPPTTVISLGGGGGGGDAGADGGSFGGSKSCTSFGGYHGDVLIGTQDIAYAVLPECPTFGSYKGVDVITTTTSHELSEAVTDPDTAVIGPAYITTDDNHLVWASFLGGGEIGDMCAQFPSSYYKPTDFTYLVQRNWSNKQAKAGHDPCVPADTSAYFNAMPVLPDTLVTFQNVQTKGVNIPIGTPRTIDIDLFSDAPTTGNIIVTAQALTRTGVAPVTIVLDKPAGLNGEVLHATLTSTGAFTNKSKTATLVLTASNGTRQNLWLGMLGQQ